MEGLYSKRNREGELLTRPPTVARHTQTKTTQTVHWAEIDVNFQLMMEEMEEEGLVFLLLNAENCCLVICHEETAPVSYSRNCLRCTPSSPVQLRTSTCVSALSPCTKIVHFPSPSSFIIYISFAVAIVKMAESSNGLGQRVPEMRAVLCNNFS